MFHLACWENDLGWTEQRQGLGGYRLVASGQRWVGHHKGAYR